MATYIDALNGDHTDGREQLPSFDRSTLIEEYVTRIVEDMDTDDMYDFIYQTLCDRLDDYTDNDLVNEVATYYPDLVENA